MTEFKFYLNELSFEYKDTTTIEELNKKIEQLSIDYDYIKKQNEKIFKNDSIYEVAFFENFTLEKVLYSLNILDKEQQRMLGIIIDRSKDSNLSNQEIINLLPNHNQDLVRGFLAFNEIEDVNKRYIVYDKNDWFDFHHYFLGLYPISEEHFKFIFS